MNRIKIARKGIILDINNNKIKVIPARKENIKHKKGILKVFNENIKYFYLTNKPINMKQHDEWWVKAFKNEIIYVILYDMKVSGYIRLAKKRTKTKEKNEISIALSKNLQNSGIGSYALNIFENEMKKKGIRMIIANTKINNSLGQRFFEKNNYKKRLIRYEKRIIK